MAYDPLHEIVKNGHSVEQCTSLHTSRLAGSFRTLSRQLLHQEHEQGANLGLVAIQKGLVADFPFVAKVLDTHCHVTQARPQNVPLSD